MAKPKESRNKRLLIFVLAFLLLFSVPGLALDNLYPAKVERVVDGDTIIVSLSRGLDVVLEHQWIRLYDMNAWETKGEEKEKGLKAEEYLEERLKERKMEVEIRPEWGQNGKGSFGRWLAIVYVDGVDINFELIEKGYAVKYEE